MCRSSAACKEVLQEVHAQLDAANAKPNAQAMANWWKQINEWRKLDCLSYEQHRYE